MRLGPGWAGTGEGLKRRRGALGLRESLSFPGERGESRRDSGWAGLWRGARGP